MLNLCVSDNPIHTIRCPPRNLRLVLDLSVLGSQELKAFIHRWFSPVFFHPFPTEIHSFVASWHLRFCPRGSLDQVVHSSKFQSVKGWLIFGILWDITGIYLDNPLFWKRLNDPTVNSKVNCTCFALATLLSMISLGSSTIWLVVFSHPDHQGHGIRNPILQDLPSLNSFIPQRKIGAQQSLYIFSYLMPS